MRALLMACLAAVLCVDVAKSLTCYTCTNQTSNAQCLTTSPCTKNETACVTIVEKKGAGIHQQKLISKDCISTCDVFQDLYECCSQDNCNRNEASGMRPPTVVLGTAVLMKSCRVEKEGVSRELIAQAALFRGAAPASSSLLFGGLVSGDSWRCLLISSTKLPGNSYLGSRSGTGSQKEAPEGLKLPAPALPTCKEAEKS
ncbi:lymphocyte antigen 6E-like [Strix uralensis]|uniref:lymphocyte antigen 6E-like n=1 Tax=Strix uralensis TaxID=36305 RepID=UPI003DA4C990